MQISKIEVAFARPVDITDREMQAIDEIVNDAARRTETPEFVHWAAGCGCKPNWSKTDCAIFGYTPTADSPDTGEPTWDDSVLYFETATRERYESDPFKPYQKRLSETEFLLRRVAQLLGGWREAIVELEDFCSDPVRLKNMLAAADQIDEIAPRIKAALHL